MTKDCSTCIYKEGACYPSITIFDKDKTCKSYNPDYEGYIADLEKENAELKAEKGCETCTKFDEVKLTKAKEIIRDLMSFSVQLCDCRHTVDFEKTREQAEQFLNGDGCPDILCVDCTKEDCTVRKLGLVEK